MELNSINIGHMKDFTEMEINEIVQMSIEVHTNMLMYLCRGNLDCRYTIKRHIRAVTQNSITPELYWHENKSEFEWLLVLLSDEYPGKQELLSLARSKTNGEIKRIADYFYQHINVMFEYDQKYAGYAVLKPSAYMLMVYPHVNGKLYVYTADKWNNRELSDTEGVFMIIDQSQVNELPDLIKKKCRGY